MAANIERMRELKITDLQLPVSNWLWRAHQQSAETLKAKGYWWTRYLYIIKYIYRWFMNCKSERCFCREKNLQYTLLNQGSWSRPSVLAQTASMCPWMWQWKGDIVIYVMLLPAVFHLNLIAEICQTNLDCESSVLHIHLSSCKVSTQTQRWRGDGESINMVKHYLVIRWI